jgi:hypothetical protein
VAFPPQEVDSLAPVVGALELIRKTDRRRFARIERLIKLVFLGNWKSLGFYSPIGRVCGLSLLASPSNSYAVYGYASVLIHEATHALLEDLRFPYSNGNKARIERICRKEEIRFLTHFPGIHSKLPSVFGCVTRRKGLANAGR